jgi:hypothetical protein
MMRGAPQPETALQLAGLRFKLQPCRCKCDAARIADGQWKNLPLCCERCGRERGRLNDATQHFLGEFIKLLGRPTSPIEIKPSNIDQEKFL